MSGVLVDTCVLIDALGGSPKWAAWSEAALASAANHSQLYINPVIYAELGAGFDRIEELDDAVPASLFTRLPLPWEAAYLAGRAFLAYRQRGGQRDRPLPDFLIGAHAAVAGLDLLTRDAQRFRTYFPSVRLIAP